MKATLLACLLLACSATPEPIEAEHLGVGACGPDGYVLQSAAVGDIYQACDDRIQSVVISNGEVAGGVSATCWTLTVRTRLSATAPLVIQFRDANHATLCPSLAQL